MLPYLMQSAEGAVFLTPGILVRESVDAGGAPYISADDLNKLVRNESVQTLFGKILNPRGAGGRSFTGRAQPYVALVIRPTDTKKTPFLC